MAGMRNHAEMARKNIDAWFVETPLGEAFLPGDGRALVLKKGEADAFKADAARLWYQESGRTNRTVGLHIAMVIALIAGFNLAAGGGTLVRSIVDGLVFLFMAFHGLAIAHAVWRSTVRARALRERIGQALASRASLPPEVAGPLARREPNYGLVCTIVFALFGLMMVAHHVLVSLRHVIGTERAMRLSDIAVGGTTLVIIAVLLVGLAMAALRDFARKTTRR